MTEWTKYNMSLDREAQALSRATGLRRETCKLWMQETGIICVPQLMERYPKKSHAQCIQFAAGEIEDFILSLPIERLPSFRRRLG